MKEIEVSVNELVSTRSNDVQYTFINLKKQMRQEDLRKALQSLACMHDEQNNSIGFIINSSGKDSQMIENHPGFKMLIDHEASGNIHFHKWINKTYTKGTLFGYELLKSRLTCADPIIPVKGGVYVLLIASRPKPFFYVGKAENIERRIEQHRNGTGAYCIAGEPFMRVEPVTKGELLNAWSVSVV